MDELIGYLVQVQQVLDELEVAPIERVVHLLEMARLRGRTVFVMGNGGSASTASHLVADLSKNTRQPGWPNFRVIGLADNMASITAYANDEGYENVFARQLESFVKAQDVVIAISASGNSPNVINAIDLAQKAGAATVGLTGFDGGKLGRMVDVHLHVPSNIIEQVEDVHLMLEHMLVKTLRERAKNRPVDAAPARAEVVDASQVLERLRHALETSSEVGEVLGYALQVSLESLGAASGSIVLLDDQGRVVNAVTAYAGRVNSTPAPRLASTLRAGLAGWVVENRRAALVENTLDDPRWLPSDWEAANQVSRSAVSVPLMEGERVVGVMTLANTLAQFRQEHLFLLATIAVLVTTSRSNEEAVQADI